MSMNGAESLVHTLLRSGVDTCFANPGTSEMHFVAALDRVPGMHCVLGLFEGVVTGAADGYARMAGQARPRRCCIAGPASPTALANLHNARRANTLMVNCVGDQATYHRPLDAPLTADTEGWARGVSGWVRTATQAAQVGAGRGAWRCRRRAPRPGRSRRSSCPPTRAGTTAAWWPSRCRCRRRRRVSPHAIAEMPRACCARGEPTMLAARQCGAAGRHARRRAPHRRRDRRAADGAELQRAASARGRGRHPIDRVPYPVDAGRRRCSRRCGTSILVGAPKPVDFLRLSRTSPARLSPDDATVHVLTRPEHDQAAALAALADELGAPQVPPPDARRGRSRRAAPITTETFAPVARGAAAGERDRRRRERHLRPRASIPATHDARAA